MRALLAAVLAAVLPTVLLPAPLTALRPDVVRSVGAVPPHLAGRFREAVGFQQAASGQYFIFDRRLHVVFGIDEGQTSAWEIVHIGGEPGRIINPTAFSVEPGGTFVVADAPNNQARIQIFSPAGFRIGGFMLPGRAKMRVVFEHTFVGGIGTLQYTGTSILMSQPETGALITEYLYVFDSDGDKVRAVQFRGAGPIAPTSLFFGSKGRLLVTPGLYEFAP
jgi:hypothetical protein